MPPGRIQFPDHIIRLYINRLALALARCVCVTISPPAQASGGGEFGLYSHFSAFLLNRQLLFKNTYVLSGIRTHATPSALDNVHNLYVCTVNNQLQIQS